MTRKILAVALSVGVALSMMLGTAVAHNQQAGTKTPAANQIGTTPANHLARAKPSACKPRAQKAMSYAPLHAKRMISVNSQSIH
jgi:hypothetical protein